jgi:hypothetical protein
MAQSVKTFSTLLSRAIRRIHAETGIKISDIEDEIGQAIGFEGGDMIRRWRYKRELPEITQLEALVKKLVKQEGIRTWDEAEEFLSSGGHSEPSNLRGILFPEQSQVEPKPLFKRTRMSSIRTLAHDGFATTYWETEIEVLSGYVDSVRHRKWSKPAKFSEFHIEFRPGYFEGSMEMREEILESSNNQVEWLVVFDPPLLRGQKASYTCVEIYHPGYAMTREESIDRYQRGVQLRNYQRWRQNMLVHTDVMYTKHIFPSGYPISVPKEVGWFGVYVGSAQHQQETARIIATDNFSVEFDDSQKQWVMEFTAQPAYSGFGYELRWLAPYAADIKLSY